MICWIYWSERRHEQAGKGMSTTTTSEACKIETVSGAAGEAARLRAEIERDRTARDQAAARKPEDGDDEEFVGYEMPEVELVCKGLRKEVLGLTVENAEAFSLKCLRSYFFRKYFTSRLVGAKIESVDRIGLYVTLGLSTDSVLVMSLGASGSPRCIDDNSKPPVNTEVLITFAEEGCSRLCFVDSVGTGQLFLVPADGIDAHLPETVGYGHDPLKQIAWTTMGQWLLRRDDELKALLTDDGFIVGISDIYADEILFDAGLRYNRSARTLTSQEIRRLHRSLVKTLFDAMKYGGVSMGHRSFIDPLGREGVYGNHLKVWGRYGQLSDRSRTPIRRVQYGSSWTYYCDTQV